MAANTLIIKNPGIQKVITQKVPEKNMYRGTGAYYYPGKVRGKRSIIFSAKESPHCLASGINPESGISHEKNLFVKRSFAGAAFRKPYRFP
jgi:hypothetical protein